MENKSIKKIEPSVPSGFRDYGPADAIARQEMIDTIRTTFERFGFDPMETPAIERTEILTGGEKESQKIIFGVKGSEEKSDEPATKSLRFDLTVPLARFLSSNPDVILPFKRYQIGNVWRGERAQAGRFRQFTQADIDIIGAKSEEADAEIILVLYKALTKLGVDDFTIELNSRASAFRMLKERGVSEAQLLPTLTQVDKKEKLPENDWIENISKTSGMSADTTKEYIATIENSCPEETTTLQNLLINRGIPKNMLRYNGAMVRGLGYYTGTIFETTLNNLPEFGSIASGGRYDGLTQRFSPLSLAIVGGSIGVDRLYSALEALGKTTKKETRTEVLILNLQNDFMEEYNAFRSTLQDANINTAIYLGDDDSFQGQLAYAIKKGISYVLIYGEEEKKKEVVQIKNLATREQREVAKDTIKDYFIK